MKRLLCLAALAGLLSAGAHAQTTMQFPTTPWGGFAPGTVECGWLKGANFNSTADQAITLSVPTATYWISNIEISSPSVSMTTAVGGFYSGASKSGVTLVANTQVYSALTTNAANTTGNFLQATLTTAGNTTEFSGPTQGSNAQTTIYFALTTAQGAAATANIRVYCHPHY